MRLGKYVEYRLLAAKGSSEPPCCTGSRHVCCWYGLPPHSVLQMTNLSGADGDCIGLKAVDVGCGEKYIRGKEVTKA